MEPYLSCLTQWTWQTTRFSCWESGLGYSALIMLSEREQVMESEARWRNADCALYSALPWLPETQVIAAALFQTLFTPSEIIIWSVCPHLGQKKTKKKTRALSWHNLTPLSLSPLQWLTVFSKQKLPKTTAVLTYFSINNRPIVLKLARTIVLYTLMD